MGNGLDHHRIQHHRHHFFHRNSIFLPMLCRLSIKDIKLSGHRRHDPKHSDEPSSPKVSCMGQVKRSNRVAARAAASPVAATQPYKYSKLKKLFSSKTLLSPPTNSSAAAAGAAAAAAAARSKSCRGGNGVCGNNWRRLKSNDKCEQEYLVKVINVDIGELDPPLPVVKRVAPPCAGENLWRRRFNGAALTNLQVQQIRLQNSNPKTPTTV